MLGALACPCIVFMLLLVPKTVVELFLNCKMRTTRLRQTYDITGNGLECLGIYIPFRPKLAGKISYKVLYTGLFVSLGAIPGQSLVLRVCWV